MPGSVYEFASKIKESVVDLYQQTIGKFIASLFKKPCSILFLGIDNAGKTTLVNKLKNNTNHIFLPTKHATKDVIEIGNLKAQIFDIGGHRAVRIAWKDYFYNVDGIVFIVDVVDDSRYNEVAESWKTVIELEKEAPILVLMNKIDLMGYNTSQEARMDDAFRYDIETKTGINKIRNPNQPVNIVYLSVLREDVYKENTTLREAFTWMSKTIDEKGKKMASSN